jgi:2-polyprenyl-6-methoxyphenol hydroxylase-like FAD-dependent oxidoreductase
MLAGDAFHLMPPFIGQGLNSGFRDAAALAWRLPLLVSGVCSSQSLLQSYHSERLDHVRKLTVSARGSDPPQLQFSAALYVIGTLHLAGRSGL